MLNQGGLGSSASVSGTNMTVSAVASGTLAANQILCDKTGLVAPGTKIVSQSSGTAGGAGVYVISSSQTIASQTMYGVVANQAEVTANIDQYPSIAAPNIALTTV